MEYKVTSSELEVIKNIEFSILREIKRICEVHNIQYFLVGGTLIGAVRHKGFIPWDDDIDIGMLRKDYEKFLQIAINELNEKYQVVNNEIFNDFGEPFTKIMDKNTIMEEKFAKNGKFPKGVFVDIFPFDNIPDNKYLRIIQRFKNYTLRKLMLLNCDYNFRKIGWKFYVYQLLKIFSHILKREKIQKKYKENAVKYNKDKSKYVVNLGGNYGYNKESVPYSWIEDTTSLIFEKELFSVPVKYDSYLSHIYGDYLKLPPLENQINKHTLAYLDLSYYIKGE